MTRAGVTVDADPQSGGELSFWTIDQDAAAKVIAAVQEAIRTDPKAGYQISENGGYHEISFGSASDEIFNQVLRIACEAESEANRRRDGSRRRNDR